LFSLVGWTFDFIVHVMTVIGLPGLFALMVVESFGIPPLPSEVILPFAGVLLATGTPYFSWPSVLAVALAGSLVGAYIAYALGEWGGRPLLLRWGGRIGLDADKLDRAEVYFRRHGPITVCLCRMVPLIRAYISYPAGAAEMDGVQFGVYTFAGALPFVAVMVYLGTLLGAHYTVLQSYFTYLDVVVVVAALAALGYFLWRLLRRPSGA
jgi:membrane protein DedA with SNARE-associated domain